MNEEKDRFGDFIRLLERAREDVYFAEKDRELIGKLARRLEKTQQAQLEHPTLRCPRCGVELHNSNLLEFPVNHCPGCGGIWLDQGVLQQFMKVTTVERAVERPSGDSLRSVWPAGIRADRPAVKRKNSPGATQGGG